MKRKIHLLLALGLSCYLVGSAPAENSAKESSESNILSENDVETDADELQDATKCVTAEIYGYMWTVKLDEDQMSTLIACGMHPLDDPGEVGSADYVFMTLPQVRGGS